MIKAHLPFLDALNEVDISFVLQSLNGPVLFCDLGPVTHHGKDIGIDRSSDPLEMDPLAIFPGHQLLRLDVHAAGLERGEKGSLVRGQRRELSVTELSCPMGQVVLVDHVFGHLLQVSKAIQFLLHND